MFPLSSEIMITHGRRRLESMAKEKQDKRMSYSGGQESAAGRERASRRRSLLPPERRAFLRFGPPSAFPGAPKGPASAYSRWPDLARRERNSSSPLCYPS